MHISRKAIITILICLVVVFVGYQYYRSIEKPEPAVETNSSTMLLHVGESGTTNGMVIIVNGVAEDSRCPEGVKCIQAGKVAANVTLGAPTDSTTTILTSSGNVVNVGGYQVFMQNVMPKKGAAAIDQGSYVFTFLIKKTVSLPQ